MDGRADTRRGALHFKPPPSPKPPRSSTATRKMTCSPPSSNLSWALAALPVSLARSHPMRPPGSRASLLPPPHRRPSSHCLQRPWLIYPECKLPQTHRRSHTVHRSARVTNHNVHRSARGAKQTSAPTAAGMPPRRPASPRPPPGMPPHRPASRPAARHAGRPARHTPCTGNYAGSPEGTARDGP
jgi:hypothetical protein